MKMKRRRKPSLSRSRTSPATLATLAGAAVCLSAVSNDAAAVYSAAGNKVSSGSAVSELGGKIRVSNSRGQVLRIQGTAASVTGAVIARNGTAFGEYDAGVKCSTALSWVNEAKAPAGGASKYIKIRFKISGTTVYGWSQFEKSGTTYLFGPWSYNESGGGIMTLADTLTAARLPLADGKVMLHWVNRLEDGLAAYHLQKKSAAGAWEDVGSFAPGSGTYSVVASGDGRFRVVAERVDGGRTSREF